MSACLFVCLCVSLSAHLSAMLYVSLYVCLPVFLSVFVFLSLSLCLPPCLPVCLPIRVSFCSVPPSTHKKYCSHFSDNFPVAFSTSTSLFRKIVSRVNLFLLLLLQKSLLLLSLPLAVVVCPFDSHIQLSDKKVQHLQANITDQRMSNSSHNIWHCLPYNTVITLNLLKSS